MSKFLRRRNRSYSEGIKAPSYSDEYFGDIVEEGARMPLNRFPRPRNMLERRNGYRPQYQHESYWALLEAKKKKEKAKKKKEFVLGTPTKTTRRGNQHGTTVTHNYESYDRLDRYYEQNASHGKDKDKNARIKTTGVSGSGRRKNRRTAAKKEEHYSMSGRGGGYNYFGEGQVNPAAIDFWNDLSDFSSSASNMNNLDALFDNVDKFVPQMQRFMNQMHSSNEIQVFVDTLHDALIHIEKPSARDFWVGLSDFANVASTIKNGSNADALFDVVDSFGNQIQRFMNRSSDEIRGFVNILHDALLYTDPFN